MKKKYFPYIVLEDTFLLLLLLPLIVAYMPVWLCTDFDVLILWFSFLRKTKRSSHLEVFYKIGVLKNFEKLTGKHLCRSLFSNKVAALTPASLLKQRLQHRCFLVNFAKYLRTALLKNTSGGCFWPQYQKLV